PDGRPAVVYTFLGRQHGRAGRELEQVLGVRVGPDLQPAVLEHTADWMPEADAAAPSKGVWDRHFAAWGAQAQERAGEAAHVAFQKVAERFARDHQRLLDEEQRRLADWLRGRADEICGPARDEEM